jgi:pyridoxamine 5'-phosphate oxidase
LADTISEKSVDKNPFTQFSLWYNEALKAGFLHPDAVALATSSKEGKPSARMVLLKGFDNTGFVFYTNYDSRKGKELSENPNASLLFYWDKLDKQVRIEGKIEKISRSESEEYFRLRPRGSQLGAIVSDQSDVIESRDVLDKRFSELEEKYKDKEIPMPLNWGGYKLIPVTFEFWHSRPDRLHDRIRYTLKHKDWVIERLAP